MRVVTPPTGLAVEVSDLAAQLHFDSAEDAMIAGLIEAATDVVETATNRPILTREVEIDLPVGSWEVFWLPCAPVTGLIGAGGAQLLSPFDEPRLVRGDFGGGTIVAQVGYGPTSVSTPPRLRQAVILLVKEWRDASITVEQAYNSPQMSFGVRALLRQSRYKRPRVI